MTAVCIAPAALCLADVSSDWHVTAAGGGRSSVGAYTIEGTIGQPFAGSVEAMPYHHDAGYWYGVGGVACPGDFNDDNLVSVADLFSFLDAWFTQFPSGTPASPSADFDRDNSVTVSDLFGFLDAWFAEFGVCGQ